MLAAAVALMLAGCTTERNGVVRHVIIGFGVVSVNKTNPAALIVSAQAAGFYAASGPGAKFALGYLNQTAVSAQTNSNVILELRR
jgi:hypothetical protein